MPATLVGRLRLIDAGPSSRGRFNDDDLLQRLLDFGVVSRTDQQSHRQVVEQSG